MSDCQRCGAEFGDGPRLRTPDPDGRLVCAGCIGELRLDRAAVRVVTADAAPKVAYSTATPDPGPAIVRPRVRDAQEITADAEIGDHLDHFDRDRRSGRAARSATTATSRPISTARAALSADEWAEILRRRATGLETNRSIARAFGVTPGTITNRLRRAKKGA